MILATLLRCDVTMSTNHANFFLPKVEDVEDKRDVIKMDCGHKGRASLTWNDKIQDKGVDVMRRCLLGSSKQF